MSSPRASDVRVSVILPVYGTAPFVADALDSVVGQTFCDYEIIVVNDGSPDSQLLEKLLQPFRRDALTAIAKLTVAARYTGSWKLWIVIVMLKIAPGSLLRLYQLRERRSLFRFS